MDLEEKLTEIKIQNSLILETLRKEFPDTFEEVLDEMNFQSVVDDGYIARRCDCGKEIKVKYNKFVEERLFKEDKKQIMSAYIENLDGCCCD